MFKSKLVKWGEHKAAPFNTPGFRFEKPKFWSCKNRDLEAESIAVSEHVLGYVDDDARARAKEYADSHKHCKLKHLSWHGSLTYFFPLTSRLDSIKFWYMGFPSQGGKILQVRRREDCYFCSKPACGWRNVRKNRDESTSYSACLDHIGRV